MESKKYRVVEGYGTYFNKRWEVQEQYFYYENGEKVTSWHTVFHSKDKKMCDNVMKKYSEKPKKDYRIQSCEAFLV